MLLNLIDDTEEHDQTQRSLAARRVSRARHYLEAQQLITRPQRDVSASSTPHPWTQTTTTGKANPYGFPPACGSTALSPPSPPPPSRCCSCCGPTRASPVRSSTSPGAGPTTIPSLRAPGTAAPSNSRPAASSTASTVASSSLPPTPTPRPLPTATRVARSSATMPSSRGPSPPEPVPIRRAGRPKTSSSRMAANSRDRASLGITVFGSHALRKVSLYLPPPGATPYLADPSRSCTPVIGFVTDNSIGRAAPAVDPGRQRTHTARF